MIKGCLRGFAALVFASASALAAGAEKAEPEGEAPSAPEAPEVPEAPEAPDDGTLPEDRVD